MDLAANELSIYDKLSETVDLVRQTGHQCGMSEKAIEKFIRQLLEKNEPQRRPPQYPLLLAVYKVFITLGLILLTAYFVIQPFSPLPPEPVLSGAYTWRSLIHHIRLMSLPITKKYMPENKGVPLHGDNEDRLFPDFDPWWTNDCEQNESDPIPANCTGCAQKLPLQVMLLEDTPRKFERLHPLVIKTGQSLSTEGLQDFLCQYPEVTEGFTEEFFTKWWRCFPGRWFPFPYPWRRPLNRSHILRELFPVFTYLPFPKEASLKKCFLLQPEPIVGSKMHRMHDLFTVGSGGAMLQLLPPFQCRSHCQSVAVPLGPGDIDQDIETKRGEVTIPRPNRQLGKASVLSDSFYSLKPEEVQFRFDETLSVPSLLVKQLRQYVRATVTQGNTTFLVDRMIWSQPHSHDPPLAP